MYAYFSDLHVQLLARGTLNPGEQLRGQAVTTYKPWWALGLINKTYLVLATDQRLVLLEHKLAWFHQAQRLESVDSIPWANVQEARLKGLFAKKLRLRAQGERGPRNLDMMIPNALFGLLAPMKNNMDGARGVVSAFQAPRLPGGATVPSLPSGGYGAPHPHYALAPHGAAAMQAQAYAPGAGH